MALQLAVGDLIKSGAFSSQQEIESLYWNRRFDLPGDLVLAFTNREILHRAAVKYGRAIAYAQQMAGWIAEAMGSRCYEIELSVDETETPTSALDHLFIASELRRRNLRPISLAPRFLGDFEPGVEYRGEIDKFEASLRQHIAIARRFGPYKLSVHSGSDKFRIYPILGRVCRSLLHVKTIGTSYLEGLRVVARMAPQLFLEIVECARTRYETDRTFYQVSARLTDARAPSGLNPKEREQEYLDQPAGRQVLHVTAGSVLSAGVTLQGRPFRQAVIEVLESQPVLYRDLLARHLGRHIELLSSG